MAPRKKVHVSLARLHQAARLAKTDWEIKFMESVAEQYARRIGQFTPRQGSAIRRIIEKYTNPQPSNS